MHHLSADTNSANDADDAAEKLYHKALMTNIKKIAQAVAENKEKIKV